MLNKYNKYRIIPIIIKNGPTVYSIAIKNGIPPSGYDLEIFVTNIQTNNRIPDITNVYPIIVPVNPAELSVPIVINIIINPAAIKELYTLENQFVSILYIVYIFYFVNYIKNCKNCKKEILRNI